MDHSLHNLRRDVIKSPDDTQARDRMLRSWIRSRQFYDARRLLRAKLSERAFTVDDLDCYVSLGRETGFISDRDINPSSLLRLSTLFHARRAGMADIELEVGFAGVEGAGALVSVAALADFFGATLVGTTGSGLQRESPRSGLPIAKIKPSETCYEFRIELDRPIHITSAFQISSIRVTAIPTAARKVTLRRRVLKTINALAFVIDSRSTGEGETNEKVFARINRDFEDVWGSALGEFRLCVQYTEPAPLELHRVLLAALGLGHVPRIFSNIETSAAYSARPNPAFANFAVDSDKIVAHEGVLDSFSLLLAQTIRDIRSIARGFLSRP